MLISNAPLCVFQSFGQHDFIEPDPYRLTNGVAFRRSFTLSAGRFAWLVQWQVELLAFEKLEAIKLVIVDIATGFTLSEVEINGKETPFTQAVLENIVIITENTVRRNVEISGSVFGALGQVRLRHIKVVEIAECEPSRDIFFDETAKFETMRVKTVFIGATNICNANCPNCPTNKKMTGHLDRGYMDMDIFERFIRQLDGIAIDDGLLFGLYGEPFCDPHLEERVKLIKRLRPALEIDIATNAGAADTERVARIVEYIRHISIHIEAATPDIYNKLMVPLKAKEVFPKVEEIIRLAPRHVSITTPLHRGNCHEASAILHRWGRHGIDVRFSTLQTRATDFTMAKRSTLAPTPGFWKADLLDILVIDWDGTVLATCDDFLRRQPLGDLKSQSVAEVLSGATRRQVFEALRTYRWNDLPSIYDAIVDDKTAIESFGNARINDACLFELTPDRFQHAEEAYRELDTIKIGHTPKICVFGPYIKLPVGRYIVRFKGTAKPNLRMALLFEAVSNFGERQLGVVRREGVDLEKLDVALEFLHERPEESLEFRILLDSGQTDDEFVFTGVTIRRV